MLLPYSPFINERISAGYEDYISTDKMIDLSTARFKDTTWVVKNLHHDNWTYDADVINNFLWKTNCTSFNDKSFSRFMVFNEETNTKEPMVDENSNTSQWEDLENKEESTIATKLISFFRWLTSIFKMITSKLSIS